MEESDVVYFLLDKRLTKKARAISRGLSEKASDQLVSTCWAKGIHCMLFNHDLHSTKEA
jgi:hypothetical protein